MFSCFFFLIFIFFERLNSKFFFLPRDWGHCYMCEMGF